jgi:hypothetical protein
LVDGPSSNGQTGGHAAYFKRNLDDAGTTASVVTIEHTNRAGGSPGATTLRVISGYNGKISQFQALSSGLFSMGATYSSGNALLTLKMDSDVIVDPGNADRWGIRLVDNLPLIGNAGNRYGISSVMGGTFSPQNTTYALYGIYSDISNVSSTYSVYAGSFMGGNVGIGTITPSAKLHVYATQSGAFRLQDTTQSNGYVLTSDANGVGTWQMKMNSGVDILTSGVSTISGVSFPSSNPKFFLNYIYSVSNVGSLVVVTYSVSGGTFEVNSVDMTGSLNPGDNNNFNWLIV